MVLEIVNFNTLYNKNIQAAISCFHSLQPHMQRYVI